jgi:hypothetical protein
MTLFPGAADEEVLKKKYIKNPIKQIFFQPHFDITLVFLSNLVQQINIATVCTIVYSVFSKHMYDNTMNLLRWVLSLPTYYTKWYGKYNVQQTGRSQAT